jgi:competence protein ComEA
LTPVLTRDERRALLFLAIVTVAGGVLRAAGKTGSATGAGVVAPALAGQDIVQQAAQARRAQALARPLAPGERVDVDRATAEELQRLPGVGPRLAARIVADREANGPFASLSGLARVPRLGAATLRGLEPFVSFSGVAAAPASPRAVTGGPAAAGRAALPVLIALPQANPESASLSRGAGRGTCAGRPSLNRATADELMCLPGLGRVLAERIVADRTAHGPFRDVSDLARVPGIGRVRSERLRDLVTIP